MSSPARARPTLNNICHVKGQEENTLQGLGLVVGLSGTGDGGKSLPTSRALATAMQMMGSTTGKDGLLELKNAKNVALVIVTATVPAAGARQGDKLDCVVSAISAKSLHGGRLFMTPLIGPLHAPATGHTRVYAIAQGPIHLDNESYLTVGRIAGGCRLEEDFFNKFSTEIRTKEGKANRRFTLVLDKNHAGFQVAQDISELINSQLGFQNEDSAVEDTGVDLAKAIDQLNIEVMVPPQYKDDTVLFISQVLGLPIPEPQIEARVVINERAGSIVIGGNVEIGAAVVTHKNMIIEAGAELGSPFVGVNSQTSNTKLKALLDVLNAVKAPTADIIEIIKGLDRNGKLHGKLIFVE